MEKLIIGIDLCDNYTQAAVLGREDAWMLPTVICRKKAAEEWYVGEDAYKYTLVGEGVIVDKLLSLAAKEGTSTIGGVKVRRNGAAAEIPGQHPRHGACGVRRAEDRRAGHQPEKHGDEAFRRSYGQRGGPRRSEGMIHIASHTECFVHYVLNQRRDVWGGQVGCSPCRMKICVTMN